MLSRKLTIYEPRNISTLRPARIAPYTTGFHFMLSRNSTKA